MGEYVLKYADPQGGVHEEVHSAASASELREQYVERGMLIYSIKPRRALTEIQIGARKGRLHLEQFIIFNEQFVTLIRAGLPILKSLKLLTENVKNKTLAAHVEAIHRDVETGAPLFGGHSASAGFSRRFTPLRCWPGSVPARWTRLSSATSITKSWRWRSARRFWSR